MPALDGLRGIAILLVLIIHSYGVGIVHRQGFFWELAHTGWIGVDLFFVLSGYLITGILLGTRGGARYYSSFFARRALRIFPPYFLVLAGLLALGFCVPSLQTDGYRLFLKNQGWLWTFTTNVRITLQGNPADFGSLAPGTSIFNTSHFWSLAVEEQFYWFWPFVVATLPPRRLLWALVGLLALAPALRYVMVDNGNPYGAYVFTTGRMDTLCMGALVAVLEQRGQLHRLRRWAAPLALVALTAIAGLALWRGGYDALDPAVILYGYSLNAFLFALVLVHVLSAPGGLMARSCAANVLRFMGKYSYSVYLVHLLIANPLLLTSLHDTDYVQKTVGAMVVWLSLVFVVTSSGSYAVAWVLWHTVEKRFLALKRYFPYAPRAEALGAPGAVSQGRSGGDSP